MNPMHGHGWFRHSAAPEPRVLRQWMLRQAIEHLDLVHAYIAEDGLQAAVRTSLTRGYSLLAVLPATTPKHFGRGTLQMRTAEVSADEAHRWCAQGSEGEVLELHPLPNATPTLRWDPRAATAVLHSAQLAVCAQALLQDDTPRHTAPYANATRGISVPEAVLRNELTRTPYADTAVWVLDTLRHTPTGFQAAGLPVLGLGVVKPSADFPPMSVRAVYVPGQTGLLWLPTLAGDDPRPARDIEDALGSYLDELFALPEYAQRGMAPFVCPPYIALDHTYGLPPDAAPKPMRLLRLGRGISAVLSGDGQRAYARTDPLRSIEPFEWRHVIAAMGDPTRKVAHFTMVAPSASKWGSHKGSARLVVGQLPLARFQPLPEHAHPALYAIDDADAHLYVLLLTEPNGHPGDVYNRDGILPLHPLLPFTTSDIGGCTFYRIPPRNEEGRLVWTWRSPWGPREFGRTGDGVQRLR